MRTKTLSIFNLVKSDKYKCRNSDKIGTFFSSFNITNHQSFCQKMKQRHQRYVEVRRRSSVQYLSVLSTEASSRLCFSEKYFIVMNMNQNLIFTHFSLVLSNPGSLLPVNHLDLKLQLSLQQRVSQLNLLLNHFTLILQVIIAPVHLGLEQVESLVPRLHLLYGWQCSG